MTDQPARPRAIFLGGEGLRYQERAPGPELAPWVQAFWHLRCERATTLRVLPDGCMDVIGGDVVGSLSSALVVALDEGDEASGVRFRLGRDVGSLARETGYSVRHLRRRVIAATGHGPRRLARIARMQAVLAAGRGESSARTAFEFGFHDESHMINDIRALAQATPQALLAGREGS